MTVLEPCGCFSDDELDVTWPCTWHRGQTEEQRKADEEQHAIEGAAMNGWIDGGTGSR